MFENWKQIEGDVNKKEAELRAEKSNAPVGELPAELQAYITETISNDVELSSEESAMAEFRLENVKKAARLFHLLDKKKGVLQHHKLEFEKRFAIASGRNRPPQIIEAMRKIDTEISEVGKQIEELMQSSPDAFIVRNALELRNYRKQLKDSDFVLTPYGEKKLEELENNYYSTDKVPFLNGETGSGKSSIAKYFCKEVLKSESERIAGAKGIDETKIFGKISLSSDQNGPQAVFVKGPLYLAMENGVPLIIEEVNAIPPEILKSLNDVIINAKKGEEVPVIGDPHGSRVKAKPGFGVIMTGNLNRNPKAIDRYKGLYELSADFVNRIRPIDYDYLPQSTEGHHLEEAGRSNELYTLMIAMVMSDKGDINAPDGVFDDLWRLAKFTRKIQEVYSGQRDGKLFSRQGGLDVPMTATSSVVSMRDIKQVIESWKRDNFKNELDYYVYKELIAPLTNAMDIKFFVQQLQAEGFLMDESWKEVVSKAGAFDSALHAPENHGKDLEFVTVRRVVENVYGKAPERKEFPYDIEALRKNKQGFLLLKQRVEKLKEYIETVDSKEQLAVVLEQGLEFESRFEHFLKELEDALGRNDFKTFRSVNFQLEEIKKDSANMNFLKVAELAESNLDIKTGDYGSLLREWEYKIKNGLSFQDDLRSTYTEKFLINSDFLKKHQETLNKLPAKKELVEELKTLLPAKAKIEIDLATGHPDPLHSDELLQINKRLSVIASELDKDFGRAIDMAEDPRFMFRSDLYPNLSKNSDIIEGAVAEHVVNPYVRDEQGRGFIDRNLIEKTKIDKDQDVDEIFSNAEVLFQNQEITDLQRFYQKDFFLKNAEKLDAFRVSIPQVSEYLSGFIYSEPWMIMGFIYLQEGWWSRQYSALDNLKEVFKDPVVFCVKQKNGEDVLVEVERKGDYDWKISKINKESVLTHQFIAPVVINRYTKRKQ